MSGIASLARKYAEIAKPFNVKILDTRKTTPGLRLFEKFAVAVGGGIELANMGADDGFNYTGFYVSFSSTVYELASGPISVYAGLGMYGGLAVTGALTYDYPVPEQPIVVQPYVRTALLLDAGNGDPSYLMSIGAMINYSLYTTSSTR